MLTIVIVRYVITVVLIAKKDLYKLFFIVINLTDLGNKVWNSCFSDYYVQIPSLCCRLLKRAAAKLPDPKFAF